MGYPPLELDGVHPPFRRQNICFPQEDFLVSTIFSLEEFTFCIVIKIGGNGSVLTSSNFRMAPLLILNGKNSVIVVDL